jgi:hypothetical protein
MPNMKSHISNAAGVICTLGLGVFASLFSGISHMVVEGLAVHLFADMSKRLGQGIWNDLEILKTHPSKLNYDLQKVFEKSILRAINNVNILYKDKKSHNIPKNVLIQLRKEIQGYINNTNINFAESEDFKNYFNDDEQVAEKKLMEKLETILSRSDLPQSYIFFFGKNFIKQLRLCFAEELKMKENRPAWIAFSKMMMERTSEMVQEILKEQSEINKKLDNLKEKEIYDKIIRLSPRKINALEDLAKQLKDPVKLQVEFDNALQSQIASLKLELYSIKKIVEDTNSNVSNLIIFFKQAMPHWWSQKVVILIILVIISLLSLLGIYAYYQSRPFAFSVSLRWPPEMENIISHSVLRSAHVTLKLKNRLPETASMDENGVAFFKDIPNKYKNDSAQIIVNGLDDEPFKRICNSCLYAIRPDESIYIDIKSDGLDTIKGFIEDVKYRPIANVMIMTEGITSKSDSNGYFLVVIPLEKQKRRVTMSFFKPGYSTEIRSEIQVTKQSKPMPVTLHNQKK